MKNIIEVSKEQFEEQYNSTFVGSNENSFLFYPSKTHSLWYTYDTNGSPALKKMYADLKVFWEDFLTTLSKSNKKPSFLTFNTHRGVAFDHKNYFKNKGFDYALNIFDHYRDFDKLYRDLEHAFETPTYINNICLAEPINLNDVIDGCFENKMSDRDLYIVVSISDSIDDAQIDCSKLLTYLTTGRSRGIYFIIIINNMDKFLNENPYMVNQIEQIKASCPIHNVYVRNEEAYLQVKDEKINK